MGLKSRVKALYRAINLSRIGRASRGLGIGGSASKFSTSSTAVEVGSLRRTNSTKSEGHTGCMAIFQTRQEPQHQDPQNDTSSGQQAPTDTADPQNHQGQPATSPRPAGEYEREPDHVVVLPFLADGLSPNPETVEIKIDEGNASGVPSLICDDGSSHQDRDAEDDSILTRAGEVTQGTPELIHSGWQHDLSESAVLVLETDNEERMEQVDREMARGPD